MKRLFRSLILFLLGASSIGCIAGEEGDVGRVDFSLTGPAADIIEIRYISLFALSIVQPDLICEEVLSGDRDPISQNFESIVASEYTTITPGTNEITMSFRGIPSGDRTIIVEAYSGGGGRLYLGCGQTLIETGRTAAVDIAMVEDQLQP
jgi:hypothetical protein